MKKSTLLLAAILIASPGVVTLAQLNIAPPTTSPASETTRPAATTSHPASTIPSAQSVMEGILNDKAHAPDTVPLPALTATNPARTPAVAPVAPNPPKTARIQDGQVLNDKTGHVLKDEKTGDYVFTFDADGKNMTDPPITLLPCKQLEKMTQLLQNTLQPPRFKISGEVTEYKGKNYLYLRDVRVLRDLNQGIGG